MTPRYDPARNRKTAHRGAPAPPPAIIAIPEVYDEDNTLVHKAFQEQDPPDATFRFPLGFDAFKNAADEAKFDAIRKETGCKLTPEAVMGDTMGVQILGTRDQCEDAKGKLRAWSSARAKAMHTKTVAFPSVGGFNEAKEDLALRKAAAAERRKKYRADCDTTAFEGKRFNHAIVLEYKRCDWMDSKILGTYMEALDPIRMDKKCHITWISDLPIADVENGTEKGVRIGQGFFICGNNKDLMDQAVERLQNLDKQIIGRNIEALESFLVKPIPLPLDYNAHVIERKKYFRPQLFELKVNSDIDDKNIQTMHLKDVSGTEPDFLSAQKGGLRSIAELDTGAILMGNRHVTSLNIQYIDMWLMTMLEQARYWQGYLEMRISIGTCAFQTWKSAKECSLYELEEMVEERNSEPNAKSLKAYMTTELGDLETEAALLVRFLGAHHSLVCKDHVPGRELYPQCTAIFNMKSPWNSTDTLRLKAVFKENGFGEYLLDTHQWELLESGKDKAKTIVDIKLIDLKHSYTSTGISIVAGTFVTESQKAKLYSWSMYERFLKKIRVIPQNAKSDVKDCLLFDFEENNAKTGVRLLSLEQRKSYIFEIFQGPGRGYHVELFSFQMLGERKTKLFLQNEQRWSVQLWHPSWETLFYDHLHLDIAMQANWEPAEWQFFPPAAEHINDWQDVEGTEFEVGSGYKNMLDAVNIVEKVIRGEPFLSPRVEEKKENMNGAGKKKQRERRADQTHYQTFSSAVNQGKPTGAAAEFAGLKIVHVPVDKSKLTGAAKDLADLWI